MINLKNRTEYSFGCAYGKIENVLAANHGSAAAICDRKGTWGHVAWQKLCKRNGVKPIFGVELAWVDDANLREKQGVRYVSFLAKNNDGLREIYELVSIATEKFYYFPRIDFSIVKNVSDNVFIILSNLDETKEFKSLAKRHNVYYGMSPSTTPNDIELISKLKIAVVAVSDNYYPKPSDRNAYEIVAGRNKELRSSPMHILSEDEWKLYCDNHHAIATTYRIAEECNAELPKAEIVEPVKEKSLRQTCIDAAPARNIDLTNKVYMDRLDRELALIAEKNFEDYFYVVSDLCLYAKQYMLVGPARGSSCGSLVCYLLSITEIDPIPYDLLFERFIDINRKDLPDIDIDFPDNKRDMIFSYLQQKYGANCVARLGTVSRYQAKVTITDVARELKIPLWEINELKNAIVNRSTGDARAKMCIKDTFDSLEIARKILDKYPELRVSEEIEAHARHTGVHAAGIIITKNPVSWYCSVDAQTGAAQIDKYDAEELNLLKIDVLGLTTLAVIDDTLAQVNWDLKTLLNYRLDDKSAFEVMNQRRPAGIFQFEGFSIQSLCRQLVIDNIEDVISLTSLGRPGPLFSGGASEFLKRRNKEHETEHLPLCENITKLTYGIVIYQEQVMQIAREVGELTWEDVSSLRKAMSKSLGKEFFDSFFERFKVGALKNGLTMEQAQTIWDNINTMGSWAFNRSHAVAYGIISYWCMLLKAKFPLEYGAACLRNGDIDPSKSVKILRELEQAGYKYKKYDKELSQVNWSVQNGMLVGGLIGIKGIAEKTANDILKKRAEGKPLTKRQNELLEHGVTPYDSIFECEDRWGHIIKDPSKYNIVTPLTKLEEITHESIGEFCFIAKITEKNLRDRNELLNLEKHGGVRVEDGKNLFLSLTVEDDTSQMICGVNRFDYPKIGVQILENGKMGDWYIFKGFSQQGFRKINIKRHIKLSGNPKYELK
jgi:DNA-directed DNA polymerase III PolC